MKISHWQYEKDNEAAESQLTINAAVGACEAFGDKIGGVFSTFFGKEFPEDERYLWLRRGGIFSSSPSDSKSEKKNDNAFCVMDKIIEAR